MLDQKDLMHLAHMKMPFGKHKGQVLIDVPEEYLLWFSKKGFPEGKLGQLLQVALEIHINGLEHIIEPLKNMNPEQS